MGKWIPFTARHGPPTDLRRPSSASVYPAASVCPAALALAAAFLMLAAGCGQASPPGAASAEAGTDAAGDTRPAVAFADTAGHPAEEQIEEGMRRGLWEVPDDGLFRPDDAASLGEFLTALWKASGRPQPEGAEARSGGDDTQEAFQWAAERGCLEGLDTAADASLDKPLARQDAMEILYACNGRQGGMEALLTGIYDDGFPDSGQITAERKRSLYWGYYNVLIQETASGAIDPSGILSRGGMAKTLIRYMDDFITAPEEKGGT